MASGSKSEAEIQTEIRVALSASPYIRLWRNNVAKIKAPSGRWIDFGLCVGSADLIGIHSVLITPEMVGTRIGQFLAIECKTATGRQTKEQRAFEKICSSLSAKIIAARSADGLLELISNEEHK